MLSNDTKVRENGHDAKVADIDSSDRVLVVANKDDSTRCSPGDRPQQLIGVVLRDKHSEQDQDRI